MPNIYQTGGSVGGLIHTKNFMNNNHPLITSTNMIVEEEKHIFHDAK